MQVAKPKKGYKLVKTSFGKYEEIPEEWEITKLSTICKKPISGSRPAGGVGTINVGIPNLGGEHISDDGTFNFSKTKFVPKSFFDNSGESKIETNDILVVKDGATTGRVTFVDEQFPFQNSMINEHIFILRTRDGINPKWLFYFVFSKLGQDQIKMVFQGSAQGGINTSFVNPFYVFAPTYPEQQQIASILSNVDDTIQKTNQIIDQTQRLKTGMMQKLLTRGIGHTKFKKVKWLYEKEIEIPGNWNIMNLGDICMKIVDGPHVSPEYVEDGIPFLTVNNVIDGFINLKNVKYISRKDHEKFSKRAKPEFGDVLYTKGGTTGIAKVIDVDLDFSIWVHLALLKIHKEKINPKLLELFLNSQLGRKQAKLYTYGIANKDLVLGRMRKILVPLPPLPEQKQISSILSNVDTQIQKEKLHKSNLERLKKGLMQKLLTGQIRVKVR